MPVRPEAGRRSGRPRRLDGSQTRVSAFAGDLRAHLTVATSQDWKIFLHNHAAGIASLDLFVVRTISFKLLYGLVILGHLRRRLAGSA